MQVNSLVLVKAEIRSLESFASDVWLSLQEEDKSACGLICGVWIADRAVLTRCINE